MVFWKKWWWWALIVGSLAGCASAPVSSPSSVSGGPAVHGKSRWVAVDWADLPGFDQDSLHEAWGAWIRSCQRPAAALASVCAEVRGQSIAEPAAKRAWMRQRLQPYRVESLQGDAVGLLTGYFEPAYEGSRTSTAVYKFPLFGPPITLGNRKPWFTRQEIDTLAQAQQALQGRVLVYLADPIDAQILQIQGSGRVRLQGGTASAQWIRLAYAGSNDQPYRSIGRWLLDQSLVRDGSWAGIKAWMQQNPQRQQELQWVNPRVVFFREVSSDADADSGPTGAQGVALTPGRSIAVDPASVPYGTPVWISAQGAQPGLQKLVLAQDTGHAISGAVRADYFVGTGATAGELAGRIRQGLQMWVLWPK